MDSKSFFHEMKNFDRQKHKNSKNKQYIVSAIVSAYNSEKFIRGCLEDIESQTIFDRLKIVVVDSASEQKEQEIVREFQQRYDNI